MLQKFTVSILLILLSSSAQAADWSLTHLKLAVGAKYQSELMKRGASIYEGWQVAPTFAVQLFNPHLEIIGATVNYKYRFSPLLLARTRLNLSATPSPLYETNVPEPTTERDKTMEWDGYLELGLPGYGEITLEYSKDLKAHKGYYTEAKWRLSAPFLITNLFGRRFVPAIFASAGGGDQAHNEYLYGTGSGDFGITNYAVGLNITAPPAIDHFYPIFEVRYFEITGDAASGSLVNGNTNGIQFSAQFAIGLF